MTARPYTVLVRGNAVALAYEPLERASALIADGYVPDGAFAHYMPASDHAAALVTDHVERWWIEQWPARAGKVGE